MTDPAATPGETFASAIAATVSGLPGVARLVPSFREALAVTSKGLLGDTESEAAVVDVVGSGAARQIYLDLYTDGTRPAGDIVDEIHEMVKSLLNPPEREEVAIRVRVLGVVHPGHP